MTPQLVIVRVVFRGRGNGISHVLPRDAVSRLALIFFWRTKLSIKHYFQCFLPPGDQSGGDVPATGIMLDYSGLAFRGYRFVRFRSDQARHDDAELVEQVDRDGEYRLADHVWWR